MMASQRTNILIFGATGQIGQHITEALLKAQPPFSKVVAFTSPTTASAKSDQLSAWKALGLDVVTGDVTKESEVKAAYDDTDIVISCLGRNVILHQIDLLRWAEESETVRWFFPSEYGTDIEYSAASAGEKPHQLKLAVRKFIRDEVKNTGYTYLVTGPYVEMYFSMMPGAEGAGGYDAGEKKATLLGDGEGRVGFTTMPDVGKCLVAALRHPEASVGKALKVQSFETTPKTILGVFERQTGGSWEVSFTPQEVVRELEDEAWRKAAPFATGITLRRIWAEGGTLYEKTDNEIIGLKESDMESLEQVVRRYLSNGSRW